MNGLYTKENVMKKLIGLIKCSFNFGKVYDKTF